MLHGKIMRRAVLGGQDRQVFQIACGKGVRRTLRLSRKELHMGELRTIGKGTAFDVLDACVAQMSK